MIRREGAIQRYTSALQDLKALNGTPVNVHQFTKAHGISGTFVSACEKIGVIAREKNVYGEKTFLWTGNFGSNEHTALILRNHMRDQIKKIQSPTNGQASLNFLNSPKAARRHALVLDRYIKALTHLHRQTEQDGQRIYHKEFSSKHKIGHGFIRACVASGVLQKKGRRYFWTYNHLPNKETAEKVIKVVNKQVYTRKAKPTAPKPEPQPKATAPKPKAQPQEAPKRTEREQKSISILWGMISIKY